MHTVYLYIQIYIYTYSYMNTYTHGGSLGAAVARDAEDRDGGSQFESCPDGSSEGPCESY